MGHKNTKKHKANHGGYRSKPSRKEVNALLDFYNTKQVNIVFAKSGKGSPRIGTQLSLF